ncbi:hypothetical protein F4677DRAFT_449344 [Hypoxylon crocopeplum]|nr:hypothetical protein F4677DRAFT_449344 [Hypoxylon crocopeplum]
MAQKSNVNVAVAADQDLRNALIRANLALLQREGGFCKSSGADIPHENLTGMSQLSCLFSTHAPHIRVKNPENESQERAQYLTDNNRIREKKDWYTTRRVVVRKRNGRIHLSRLGSRQQQQQTHGYVSVDYDEDESQSGDFTLVDGPRLSQRSASSSFSSDFA